MEMNYYWVNKENNNIEHAFYNIPPLKIFPVDLHVCSGHLGSTIEIKVMERLERTHNSNTIWMEDVNLLMLMLKECNGHNNDILINDSYATGKTIKIKQMEIEPTKIEFIDEIHKFSSFDFIEKYKLCYDLNQLKKKLNLNIGLHELYMETDLDLSFKNLMEIPDEIVTLTYLKHINLYGNNLTTLPNKLLENHLPNLQFISLEEHQLYIISRSAHEKISFRYLRSNAQTIESREATKLNYFRLYEKKLGFGDNKIINLIIYPKSNIITSIDVKVLNVIWNTEKDGYLYPVITFDEVDLHGVMVSKVSAFSAGYVVDNKIGPGSIVRIKNTCNCIPIISVVLSKSSSELPKMPDFPYKWTDSLIHIVPKNIDENISIKFHGKKIENLTQALEYYQKMVSENNPNAEKFKKVIKCFTIL